MKAPRVQYKHYYFTLNNKGTKIGTREDKIAPFIKATSTVLLSVASAIRGRVVSIEVAPAGDMAVRWLSLFARKGMVRTAISSLKTFVKKAIVPASGPEILESITPDKLYQPKPEDIARPRLIGIPYINVARKPPNKLPAIIEAGIKSILKPLSLIL